MKKILEKFFLNKKLSSEDSFRAMELMTNSEATVAQMGAFLGALTIKGESATEIHGFTSFLKKSALSLPKTFNDLVDTCGTGGDGGKTFNISTTVALIAAAGGLKVAKHGNRAISSKCGSSDVLEALHIPTKLNPTKIVESIERFNFSFLFAPLFHPAMKNIAPIRRELGVRTVFNILGPLINPAHPTYQVIGVYDFNLAPSMLQTLQMLGSKEVMIVASLDKMDEFSISAPTNVLHLKDNTISQYTVKPQDASLSESPLNELSGGDSETNAEIIENILKGKTHGAKRDVVLFNCAAAFMVGGKVKNFSEGVEYAAEIIDSKKSWYLLEQLRDFK